MADDLAAVMRRQDKRILISIVDDIGRQLEIIVFQKKGIFRAEYQQYFPGPWRDVEERLSRARILSKRMTSTGNMWKELAWCETLCDSSGICSPRRLSRA